MANEAPADGSNRLATSTSATCAQESRSSRLTWAGSEIRAATAFTANAARGRCSVTSASTSAWLRLSRGMRRQAGPLRSTGIRSRWKRSAARARAGLTPSFSADRSADGTGLGNFPPNLRAGCALRLEAPRAVPMALRRESAGRVDEPRPRRAGRRKGGGTWTTSTCRRCCGGSRSSWTSCCSRPRRSSTSSSPARPGGWRGSRTRSRSCSTSCAPSRSSAPPPPRRSPSAWASGPTRRCARSPTSRPPPGTTSSAKHHEALLVLVTDLRSLSDANRELIEGGLAAIGDALLQTRAPSAGTYGAGGRHTDGAQRAVTLDGAL